MDPARHNPKGRFTDKVEAYSRYRPGYPDSLIEFLKVACGLTDNSQVADVGSGTGILTGHLLQEGCFVYAIEPNAAMRKIAEAAYGESIWFQSRNGSAEATGLEDSSVDLLVAAQAFHWFDPVAARREFARIVRPGGSVALIWNLYDIRQEFTAAYDQLLLEFGTDYREVSGQHGNQDAVAAFFSPTCVATREFENSQALDFEGIKGRLLSSSFIPKPDEPRYAAMLLALQGLFERFEHDGKVVLAYRCTVFYGSLYGETPLI